MKYIYVYNNGYDETMVGFVDAGNLHDATVSAAMALGDEFSPRWYPDRMFVVVPADRPFTHVTTEAQYSAIVTATAKSKAERDREAQRDKDVAELKRLRKLYPDA